MFKNLFIAVKTSILAIYNNIVFIKTKTSFLTSYQDTCLYKILFYNMYNTLYK